MLESRQACIPESVELVPIQWRRAGAVRKKGAVMKRNVWRRLGWIGLASIGGWALVAAEPAADEADPHPASFWMKKKLEYSERILEGLVQEDFDMIAKNARAMNSLSQFESRARGRTAGYRTQLRIFRFANEELIHQAEQERVDGAAVAYMQLTLSCVNCHKLIRSRVSDAAE